MRAQLFPILALLLLTVACSDPRNTPLPPDAAGLESIKSVVERLPADDKNMLVAYYIRQAMQGTILGGMAGKTDAKTVGEAIENQRNFVADSTKKSAAEKALREKAQSERDASMAVMRNVVTVALVGKSIESEKGYSGIEMDRHLKVIFAYKNNGDKDIAGVKGTIVIKDLFGDDISRFGVSNDTTIKSKQSVNWNGSRSVKYGFSKNQDEKLAELSEDKFKLVWEPEIIVFTDGSKLESKAL